MKDLMKKAIIISDQSNYDLDSVASALYTPHPKAPKEPPP
jgi:hypothetical protein